MGHKGAKALKDIQHRLRALCLCVFVFCISASAVAQTQQQWRDSLHALNRQIAAEQEWSSDLHLRKAAVNMQLQQWQYAVDEYAAILQREPHNAAALFYRAYANTHMRRYLLARNDYSNLLAVYPRHFEARLSLAYVLQLMDKQKDALDQLNLLVQTHPDSAVAYAARANMERSAGQHDAAIYDWEAAVRLAPHDAGYVASLADLLIAVNRRREARKVLDEATRRGIPRGLLAEWYGKL